MKNFKILGLLFAMLVLFVPALYSQSSSVSNFHNTDLDVIHTRTVTLASLARDTSTSRIFPIAADSVAFVIESSVDSVSAVLKIEPCTAGGATDGTAFASLTAAATKPTAGKAFMGNAITRRAALTHCKVYLITRNEDQSSQTITIKVFRVRVP